MRVLRFKAPVRHSILDKVDLWLDWSRCSSLSHRVTQSFNIAFQFRAPDGRQASKRPRLLYVFFNPQLSSYTGVAFRLRGLKRHIYSAILGE